MITEVDGESNLVVVTMASVLSTAIKGLVFTVSLIGNYFEVTNQLQETWIENTLITLPV